MQMPPPLVPAVAVHSPEVEAFLNMAETLGLLVRTPMGLDIPTTYFDSKGDFVDSLMQLAMKFRYQMRQRSNNRHLCYLCKSFPDCPFAVRANVLGTGQVKLSGSTFHHNHPLGVSALPPSARNSMLCSKTLAQSIIVADVDYVNATKDQLQAHVRATFGAEISSSRVYALKKLLESGTMGNDVNRFQKIPKYLPLPRKSDDDDDTDDDDFRPILTDAEKEREELRRLDREHRWEMDRRRLAMEETTNARLEDEARAQRRLLELPALTAEIEAKVTQAKARHELLQTGMAREDVELLLG
ncbi:Aste57867_260 [Aphanomyces stellatus]|uniref:Aste57867_260 protein n=1 Tax=Aphanomyces stellatus TaxID=120398 RepID=A0A485K4P0_9STRA|nr:hypothetical protein As57867_000260 [Aphanomyces stellatus]VFT77486.1 Aste57867_260 [Aphanomyces stellatus]